MRDPKHERDVENTQVMANAPAHPAPKAEVPVEGLGFDLPEPAHVSKSKILVIGVVALAVLGGLFAVGLLPRLHAQKELASEAKSAEAAPLKVQTVIPKAKTSDRSISLAGSVQALEETTIYPRANGYVRSWKLDIGDKVNEGDVLAEIETPELDSQISQANAELLKAKANLAQAEASEQLSTANRQRYEALAPGGVASQQELDQSRAKLSADVANVAAAKAAIAAQDANIQRLHQLKGFARLTAPISGKVTMRMVERGALVSPTTPLFKVAATETVRVFVQVPQDLAPAIRPDVPAKINVREYGGRVFDGKITRSAGSLDPTARTMLTEVRVPNGDGALIAGMYAQVQLVLPTPHRALELPATAIINDAKGVRVAIVDASNKLKLVPVVIERDTGSTIELLSGLEGTERVVKIANAELTDGRPVEIAQEPPPPAK